MPQITDGSCPDVIWLSPDRSLMFPSEDFVTRTLQERSAGAAVTVLDMTKVSKMDFTSLENLVVRKIIIN